MKFRITDGLNKIAIGLSEIGSYFYFQKPLVTTWYDNSGTVGKYLCLLPYEEDYRNEVRNRIVANLDVDFTGKEQELINILNPLLRLFKNGEYEIEFHHSSDNHYFEYLSGEGVNTFKEMPWFLISFEPIKLHDAEVFSQYKRLVGEAEEKGHYT